ncbi:LacI family DNA-binding transcriptional regulator [Pelagicoccus sp. SDUM812003]|uniref:LacI family DNA-binding transcriptional regulator n=1 Tax=Pelagicoccus sp. SDUM812003 TaxID=3041267 RepID=UPI00280D6246|nr:LacI family DNA-binding transcriptional regulator [Pelagicoccus sp. SDUM812003]MDQ8203893.1 LacI family DNA-binding transcriptional regulator [Pelagicoccus sp. SDUM812003]
MSVRKIAARLDLSPSTVSLALRSCPKISAATREKVMKEADRIGYRPNAKLNELMSHLRLNGTRPSEACFGVVSFYETLRPWEGSRHLSLIYEAMKERAESLGYRLESLGLKAPGMSPARFRSVLDTRGIQGLLCFGSPEVDQEFPSELDHYAIVTQGLSIKTPLHRVTSNFYKDLYETLDRLFEMGYRRPGLVLGRYEEDRSAFAYPSAYLGWCEHKFGVASLMPILRIDEVRTDRLLSWYRNHRPDVIVFVHLYHELEKLREALDAGGLRVPEDVGAAVVTQLLGDSGFSGMEQNQRLIGSWTVELLVSRILNQDFGIPTDPRLLMVKSKWREGNSLRMLS